MSDFPLSLTEDGNYFSETKFKYSKDCVPNTTLTEMSSSKYPRGLTHLIMFSFKIKFIPLY